MLTIFLLPASSDLMAQQAIRFISADGEPVVGLVVELHHEAAAESNGEVSIIDQINRTFVPMIRVINPGQSISFPNSDNVRHHVYSFSEIKQFSTPLYADEIIEPVKFDQPGVAVLGCNIHDSMVAYVYVSDWANWHQTGEDGRVSLTIPDSISELHLWHPWLQTPGNRQLLNVSNRTEQELTVRLDVKSPQQTFGFRALRQATP